MHFKNKEGIEYSAATPVEVLVTDDFYIELENQNYFIVNTSKTNLMKLSGEKKFSRTYSLLEKQLNYLSQENDNVPIFLAKFIEHLNKDPKEHVDR